MFQYDENQELKMQMPSIVVCKCGKQMSRILNVTGSLKAWNCKCGEVHIEEINPFAAAMEGLQAVLKERGIDLEGISPE